VERLQASGPAESGRYEQRSVGRLKETPTPVAVTVRCATSLNASDLPEREEGAVGAVGAFDPQGARARHAAPLEHHQQGGDAADLTTLERPVDDPSYRR
jgi:hypothetical protein